MKFNLVSPFRPTGDQPQAIQALARGLSEGKARQVLLGVTGSGKTFTVANLIAAAQRPALIIAPNKTLAAQLYGEFKQLFPDNAVEYFVSYYDYYQPEAYLPSTDTYIEKDASINDEIDKLRHSATRSLMEREDVIVVASVSCIYGLGSPEHYKGMLVFFENDKQADRDLFIRQLVEIQYSRNDYDFYRGTFRVRGEAVEVFPPYEKDLAYRIEFDGEVIAGLVEFDPLTGEVARRLSKLTLFPASHYVTSEAILKVAVTDIRRELQERLAQLRQNNKLLEAQRLEQRTNYDLELMEEMGVCPGIENYSRHLDRRQPGQPPHVLLDYFPKDFLLFLDESHITAPQIQGMYNGDRARKTVLVEHGFRLPSALDNRPLRFEEFWQRVGQAVFVSATPAEYELQQSGGEVVEQLVRPTGLLDPEVHLRPASGQIDDLLREIRRRIEVKERVLVTTLTKRMAEDLSTYCKEVGVRSEYLHSDIDTFERQKILRDLRLGTFDVLIGINLLREGLDLPEVSLVAILDADKEGFLRSERSLIQTCGRASRNLHGTVILYADQQTAAISRAVDETNRRRQIQAAYNQKHGVTPKTIEKLIQDPIARLAEADYVEVPLAPEAEEKLSTEKLLSKIESTRRQMLKAAAKLDFEQAATLRDEMQRLEKHLLKRR